jgi:hypothetical protein
VENVLKILLKSRFYQDRIQRKAPVKVARRHSIAGRQTVEKDAVKVVWRHLIVRRQTEGRKRMR